MYVYAVTFELKSDATYADRYRSLMDQIRATPNGNVWSETTSFCLVKSSEKIDAFESRLYLKSEFAASKDRMVVIDHLNSVAIARGKIDYPATLSSHFKSCTIK